MVQVFPKMGFSNVNCEIRKTMPSALKELQIPLRIQEFAADSP
jgi:hypothetical protein